MAWQRPVLVIAAVGLLLGAVALSRRPDAPPAGSEAPATAGASAVSPAYMPGTPAGLLSSYVEADFRGERLERANWPTKFKALVIWPAEPAWDTAYVIRSYHLQSNAMSERGADVDCTYDTLGELNLQTFAYEPSPTRQTVPYKLQNSAGAGWQIALPQLKPHVGASAAVAYLQRMAVGYPARRAAIRGAIAGVQKDAAPAVPASAPPR